MRGGRGDREDEDGRVMGEVGRATPHQTLLFTRRERHTQTETAREPQRCGSIVLHFMRRGQSERKGWGRGEK